MTLVLKIPLYFSDHFQRARQQLEEGGDPAEILRIVANLTRRMREDYGDIMRVVVTTAPHDAAAADGLALATRRYRDGTFHDGDELRGVAPLAWSDQQGQRTAPAFSGEMDLAGEAAPGTSESLVGAV